MYQGRGESIRQKIHREMHGAVVQATSAKTAARCTPAQYDIRRGRRTPWAGAVQVIDHLVAVGADPEAVLAIPRVLLAYAEDLLNDRRSA